MAEYPTDFARRVTEPANRGEQVDTAAEFIINDPAFYATLKERPDRVDAAARIAFREDYRGYHAQVIRAAVKAYDKEGHIFPGDPPYDVADLV